MEFDIMIDAQVIVAAGSVAAGAAAAIRAVYSLMIKRIDGSDQEIAKLHIDLIDCEKQHAETSERIGKLEGWRQGFADATKTNGNTPVDEMNSVD
jgi:hypothetical protein